MSETIVESRTITAPSGAEYRLEYVLEPDAENPYESGDWMLTALVVAGDRNTIDVAHIGQSGATNAERIVFERVQQYVTRFTRNYEYPRSERAVVRYLKLAGMQGITLVHTRNNGDYSTTTVDLDRLDLLGSDPDCHAAQADGFAWVSPSVMEQWSKVEAFSGPAAPTPSALVAEEVDVFAGWAAGNAYTYRVIREDDETEVELDGGAGTYYTDAEGAHLLNEARTAIERDDAERVRVATEEAAREAAEAEEAARDDAAHAAMIREEAARRADMRSAAIEYRRTVGALAFEVADGAPGVADALDFADTMAALILEGK